jgi:hypothetical protein
MSSINRMRILVVFPDETKLDDNVASVKEALPTATVLSESESENIATLEVDGDIKRVRDAILAVSPHAFVEAA